jgi:uncharacterized membrane protein
MRAAAPLLLSADTDWDHMDWGPGGWVLMAIGMALFWGLAVLGVIWLVRTFSHPGPHRDANDGLSANEILDRGLAQGTISAEEYEKRRRLLDGSSTTPE